MLSDRQGTVILIGYQYKENLGLRYLSACLKKKSYRVKLIVLPAAPEEVIKTIKDIQPDIVGFSLIFQNFAPDFADLISIVRRSGCFAHLTIGGHYPSFDYIQVLKSIPELDSAIRFEGEETLISLLEAVIKNKPLDEVKGIAWCNESGQIITNPLRPGCMNLDLLPRPDREDLNYKFNWLSTASMIGSRGCYHNCAFCSIAPFYKKNKTPGRRFRSPLEVVDEMEMLHNRGADVILFQDDDFLSGGKRGIEWAHAIASECVRRGLNRTLRWRVSCRSDEVSQDILAPLVDGGLSHVYLGVESGDLQNLIDLNKKLTPETHMVARETLQVLNLTFDFGFMLLIPWSTFNTIRNNLKFLREFAGKGEAPCGFCRTLPYAGTAIADRLKKEKRLLPGFLAKYNFEDPRLDTFHTWLYQVFNRRNNDPGGTRNLLSVLLFEAKVNLPKYPYSQLNEVVLRSLISISNTVMIDTVEIALDYFESKKEPPFLDDPFLEELHQHHEEEDLRIHQDINRWCNSRLNAMFMSEI